MASGETYSYNIDKTSLYGIVKLNDGQLQHVSGDVTVTGSYKRSGKNIEVFAKIIHKDSSVREYRFSGILKENEEFNLTEEETESTVTVKKIASGNNK